MKILIVEDEARIAKRLERMTRAFFEKTLIRLEVFNSLEDGLNRILKVQFDLVLLDLNLNGSDGFKLLQTAVAESFDTIIVSAQKNDALRAFEYGVVDFVPKPFNSERLNLAFRRALSKVKFNNTGVQFLAIKNRGAINLIKISNVIYVKGAGVYSEIVVDNGNSKLHDKTLDQLNQLLPETFERIHKSYLVKMSEAKRIIISTGSKYELELNNGELLPIGRTRYKNLKTKWF